MTLGALLTMFVVVACPSIVSRSTADRRHAMTSSVGRMLTRLELRRFVSEISAARGFASVLEVLGHKF